MAARFLAPVFILLTLHLRLCATQSLAMVTNIQIPSGTRVLNGSTIEFDITIEPVGPSATSVALQAAFLTWSSETTAVFQPSATLGGERDNDPLSSTVFSVRVSPGNTQLFYNLQPYFPQTLAYPSYTLRFSGTVLGAGALTIAVDIQVGISTVIDGRTSFQSDQTHTNFVFNVLPSPLATPATSCACPIQA